MVRGIPTGTRSILTGLPETGNPLPVARLPRHTLLECGVLIPPVDTGRTRKEC